MRLFEFELHPIESIAPWGEEPNQSLSWFALTYGTFRINVGDETLFRYSKEILQHWDSKIPDSDYQIAAFARDFLGSFVPALGRIPDFLQPYAWDWDVLREMLTQSEKHDSYYEVFRWLGERSPDTGYLTESPQISFIRKENDIIIGWDNRSLKIDGLQVWESNFGTHTISVDEFESEYRSFADRLLAEMHSRISKANSGKFKAQIVLDTEELMRQHEVWRAEFAGYFAGEYVEDISWDEVQEFFSPILNDLKTQL